MITYVCMVTSSGLARYSVTVLQRIATIIQSGRAVLIVLIIVEDGGRKFNTFKEL